MSDESSDEHPCVTPGKERAEGKRGRAQLGGHTTCTNNTTRTQQRSSLQKTPHSEPKLLTLTTARVLGNLARVAELLRLDAGQAARFARSHPTVLRASPDGLRARYDALKGVLEVGGWVCLLLCVCVLLV